METGQMLGNYKILSKIGEGGMGIVYKALDTGLGRTVAIKMLSSILVKDAQFIERFKSEARNQAKLSHPAITTVYSFLEHDDKAFLVMEFVEGEDLNLRIERGGPIYFEESLSIFEKVLDAIDYAHSQGIIHRDLKPANIVITGAGAVKIMDFGIARNLEESKKLTSTGTALGTPHYMAPEQIKGGDATFKSDIYSLGVTLYEMLTGKLPFNFSTDYEIRVAQVTQPPPPLRSLNPSLPEAIEPLVLKAMEKEPQGRYESASNFLEAVKAYKNQGFSPQYTTKAKVSSPKAQGEPTSFQHAQVSAPRQSSNSKAITFIVVGLIAVSLLGFASYKFVFSKGEIKPTPITSSVEQKQKDVKVKEVVNTAQVQPPSVQPQNVVKKEDKNVQKSIQDIKQKKEIAKYQKPDIEKPALKSEPVKVKPQEKEAHSVDRSSFKNSIAGALKRAGLNNVKVNVDSSMIVTLSGSALDDNEINEAVRIARQNPNTRNVINKIVSQKKAWGKSLQEGSFE